MSEASETATDRAAIAAAFEAWRAGTGRTTETFAPDMVWRIEGHSLASREYTSAQEFIDELLAPFGARFHPASRFGRAEIRTVLADGDTVVVLWNGHGVANDGQAYDNSYAWLMRMRDGKVIDGTGFYDSISFNDLWNRVSPDTAPTP